MHRAMPRARAKALTVPPGRASDAMSVRTAPSGRAGSNAARVSASADKDDLNAVGGFDQSPLQARQRVVVTLHVLVNDLAGGHVAIGEVEHHGRDLPTVNRDRKARLEPKIGDRAGAPEQSELEISLGFPSAHEPMPVQGHGAASIFRSHRAGLP